jgi:CRP/FNR family transcriptional regulator, cyclic AMP receptor protein
MRWKREVEIKKPIPVLLVEHPFLRGLTHHQLVLLSDCALPARFERGEIIFREGDTADRFYVIISGKIALESGPAKKPVIIERIGAGEVLGWSWMLPPYKWHFTARALEPSEAILFAADILRKYCERDHSLGFELHKRISAVMMKRLQAARKKMVAIDARKAKLEPAVLQSPFMDQELDLPRS